MQVAIFSSFTKEPISETDCQWIIDSDDVWRIFRSGHL